MIEVAETLEPNQEFAAIYEAGFQRFRAAKEALTPVNHALVEARGEAAA